MASISMTEACKEAFKEAYTPPTAENKRPLPLDTLPLNTSPFEYILYIFHPVHFKKDQAEI